MNSLVIKVGGAILDNADALRRLLSDIRDRQTVRPVVLVHGGGALVDQLLARLGFVSEKRDGLRVTPHEQMPIIAGALAGTANKTICSEAQTLGINAVGLSLIDAGITQCTLLDAAYGAVGVAHPGRSELLDLLLAKQFLPVISSVGASADGTLLNINADQAATAIAKLLTADLWLLSDVAGVLDANKRLLTSLDSAEIQRLTSAGVISAGMQVKTTAALEASAALGKPVTIASWASALVDIENFNTGTRVSVAPSQES